MPKKKITKKKNDNQTQGWINVIRSQRESRRGPPPVNLNISEETKQQILNAILQLHPTFEPDVWGRWTLEGYDSFKDQRFVATGSTTSERKFFFATVNDDSVIIREC